jgi:hypothetical protein
VQRFWAYSRILETGAPAPNALINVFGAGTLVPATLFADNLVPPTPLANPFNADVDGYIFFYAANGHYDVQVESGGIPTPYVWPDIILDDSGASPVGVVDVSLGGSRGQSIAVTGDPAEVDLLDFPAAGVLVPGSASLPAGITISVIVECQVSLGASVVARLENSVGATIATDPNPFTDDTQFVTHEFPVTLPPAAQTGCYLKLDVTGGDGLPLFAIAKLAYLLP